MGAFEANEFGMREAVTVAGRKARQAAGASIGEGKRAEVIVSVAIASGGHGESIAKNTELSRHRIGTN